MDGFDALCYIAIAILHCMVIFSFWRVQGLMEERFTLRSFLVGLVGLLVITASSMYVALSLGALPWPTVFVTVTSFAILNAFRRKPSLEEVNITHTFMSAGAMVAGGLAFTIPGFWMAQPDGLFPTFKLIVLAVSGALLGVVFTAIFRADLIEKRKLPYPMGKAAFDTLMASSSGGRRAAVLFSAMAASVAFTILRDGAGLVPALFVLVPATSLTTALTLYASPMAMGIGAMIGPLYSLIWFGGALAAHFGLVPALIKAGAVADFAEANHFREGLGIGLMLGTGIGVALKIIFSMRLSLKSFKAQGQGKKPAAAFAGLIAAVIAALSIFTDISIWQALLMVVGIALVTYLSGTLTGQTGVNPMEIFGILVFLLITAVSNVSLAGAFSIAAVTAVACGLVGDVMNDLKSGSMIGTSPKSQLIAEAIGGVIGAVAAVLVMIVLKKAFGFGTAKLPAPQAAAVGAMAAGGLDKTALVIGIAAGVLLFFLNAPTATLGLGVYLPVYLSSAMGAGAVLLIAARMVFKRRNEVDSAAGLVSSGLLGGEGITGVVLAMISILTA